MRSPCLMLPFSLSQNGGAVADISKLSMLFPNAPVPDAIADWSFGGDASCLVDRINGHTLTPAATAPTYAANYLTIASAGYNGLLSNIDDAAELTVCFVAQFMGAAGHVYVNSRDTNAAHGGFLFYENAAGAFPPTIHLPPDGTVHTLAQPAVNDWFFGGVSCSAAAPNCAAGLGGAMSYNSDVARTGPSTNKVQVGNVTMTNATYKAGGSFARVIVFDRALTADELSYVYKQVKIGTRQQKVLTVD